LLGHFLCERYCETYSSNEFEELLNRKFEDNANSLCCDAILTQKLMQTGNDVSCKVHQDTIFDIVYLHISL